MTDPKKLKSELRRKMRDKKKSLGKETLIDKSRSATACLAAMERYRGARIVMLYHPLWDEVDIRPFISSALADGKRVILPTISGDDIIPVEITLDTEWVTGDFGIFEPKGAPYAGEIDIVVVPGTAFDREGNRLGRGKGYYDRFLALHPESHRIGLCFDFQLVDSVPREPFDLKMNEMAVI